MKRIAYLFTALAMVLGSLTSCEDVPAPYYAEEPNNDTPTVTPVDPAGKGTAEDPYNVAMAKQLIANGSYSSNKVYVKGKISQIDEIDTGSYGNATYYISDSGTGVDQLEVYRGYSLGGEKFKSSDEIKVGDEVIIYGVLTLYKTTPEITQGSQIYSLNGKTSGGNTGGDKPATAAKKVTVAEFNAAAESTTDWYQLTGTVKNLKDGDKYGNFDLEDATGSVYVYGLLDKQGGEKKKFQELVAAKGIKEGSKITIIGNRGSYKDKIEVVNAYFVSIEGGSTPDQPATGKNIITNGDFETWADGQPTGWKTASSAGNATLSQSTDVHGGKYSVSVATGNTANKRMGYKEINLKAGTYTFKFFAKATVGGKAQTRAGYVPVADGKVGSYVYGNYTDLTNTGWTEVSYTFKLDAAATVCLVIMNPKGSKYMDAQAILIDDAELLTSDGGLQ